MDEKIRTLIIDDDEDDYILTKDLLCEIGENLFEIEWVSLYAKAIEAIKERTYDICLLDYHLGVHSGIEVLQEASRFNFNTPVILLTGKDDHDIDGMALRAGASNFLVKGAIDATGLHRAIRYAIKQKKEEQEKLKRAQYYDKLTNIANFYLLKEMLEKSIAEAQRYNRKFAILFLDIDNFKKINNAYGHRVGDSLLVLLVNRLKNILRKNDIVAYGGSDTYTETIARMGSDEFIILLLNTNIHNLPYITQRISDSIKNSFYIDDNEIFITASIGVSIYPHDGMESDALLKNAEVALHNAKLKGYNLCEFYEESMNFLAKKKLELESNLYKAVNNNELLLYYQPQINIFTSRIIGFEALLRWKHPEYGIIPPNDFIPIAEECGLIIPIGNWVLKNASEQGKRWQEKGYNPIKICINLSKKQFNDHDLLDNINNTLENTNYSSKFFELEITESIVMHNEQKIMNLLQSIAKLGVQLSMDDFGTGYSSFAYLKEFPINILKIDRSFIKDLAAGSHKEISIIKAIIAVAKSLELGIIAEGVETEEQLEILYGLNCEVIQGFLLSRPVPEDEAVKFLSKGNGEPAADLSIFKNLKKKLGKKH
ncbi:MAG: EAL domain-containing protein [Spirochaetales bacterium]|nr:EAL domain-containing protein [Spirochaetales bacterium]